uniref:Regulatory protein IE1 n=1 Tax=Mastomys natalensis cytomegalovirus 1 TaxID=2973541 RepID=A0A9Y1INQ9_9BETA|nr:regulatory protein IE1 [Mastomys natalensis cytomegalovirus 1]WEG71205.1 regulatory protein IE1 [Mastomys natalensis cytomegalovirus 1]
MDVTMLNSRMIRTGDYHVIHAREPAPPKVIPSSKVPKTVIDDINIHINSPVRCDMSLGDILTDCDITYVPTRTETAAMDSLSDEVGTSGSDRTVKDLAVKSVMVSVNIAYKVLDLLYHNLATDVTSDAYELANDAFDRVALHTSFLQHGDHAQIRLNVFGRVLYDSYLNFVPVHYSEGECTTWLEKLGEASVMASGLSNVLEQHLQVYINTHTSRLQREIGSDIVNAARKITGLFDPPATTRVLSSVKAQLEQWRAADVVNDDAVPTSAVIVEALDLRKKMAGMLREITSYILQEFNRLRRTVFSSVKDGIESKCFEFRTDMLYQENRVKMSRYNMAVFLLTELGRFNSYTMMRVKKAFEEVTADAFMDRLISLRLLREVAYKVQLQELVERVREERRQRAVQSQAERWTEQDDDDDDEDRLHIHEEEPDKEQEEQEEEHEEGQEEEQEEQEEQKEEQGGEQPEIGEGDSQVEQNLAKENTESTADSAAEPQMEGGAVITSQTEEDTVPKGLSQSENTQVDDQVVPPAPPPSPADSNTQDKVDEATPTTSNKESQTSEVHDAIPPTVSHEILSQDLMDSVPVPERATASPRISPPLKKRPFPPIPSVYKFLVGEYPVEEDDSTYDSVRKVVRRSSPPLAPLIKKVYDTDDEEELEREYRAAQAKVSTKLKIQALPSPPGTKKTFCVVPTPPPEPSPSAVKRVWINPPESSEEVAVYVLSDRDPRLKPRQVLERSSKLILIPKSTPAQDTGSTSKEKKSPREDLKRKNVTASEPAKKRSRRGRK